MRHVLRRAAVLVACGLLAIGVVATAQGARDEKVRICHGTASATNPYVLITVDEHALAGHFDGTAPGHGPNNHPDVLLADGETECPGGGGEEIGEEGSE